MRNSVILPFGLSYGGAGEAGKIEGRCQYLALGLEGERRKELGLEMAQSQATSNFTSAKILLLAFSEFSECTLASLPCLGFSCQIQRGGLAESFALKFPCWFLI